MGSLVLFGSQIGFIIALVALFIAFILADVYENGYSATICALIFVGLNYFWGNLVWLSIFTWTTVGSYLFVGFLFSLVRTYFKGKEFNRDVFYNQNKVLVDSNGHRKDNFDLKGNVFRWWFLFPISAITWVFGHLVVDLWNFLYSKVEGLYNYLFYGKK